MPTLDTLVQEDGAHISKLCQSSSKAMQSHIGDDYVAYKKGIGDIGYPEEALVESLSWLNAWRRMDVVRFFKNPPPFLIAYQ